MTDDADRHFSCGGCGAPLSHINAVCDVCLPNFYSTRVPPDERPAHVTVEARAREMATDPVNYFPREYCNMLKDCADELARKDAALQKLRGKATDLDALVVAASKAVLKVLEHDGGDFSLDKGPHGGWLIKHEEYFSFTVAMRAAVVAVLTEVAHDH